MKKHNLLIALTLSSLFLSCKDEKKVKENLFSINTTHLKQLYRSNELLKLNISNDTQAAIDSVVYFIADQKIGSSLENQDFEYALDREKFGVKNLKALIYHSNNHSEVTSKFELAAAIAPKILNYKIVNTYAHDIKAYTQGLEFYGEVLMESTGNGAGNGTGLKGISSVRKTEYKTGKVLQIAELPSNIFGEGATVYQNRLYQLTYQNNEAYVYNIETLTREKTLPYFKKMEGWGLTNDGKQMYMTDGTEKIYILDPETFEQKDYLNVYTNNVKVMGVNELEWVDGKIYANIYGENGIAIINPTSGAVEAAIDLSQLISKVTHHPDLDVLNGIAYHPKTKTFFVTGKNWDKMFEIEIY